MGCAGCSVLCCRRGADILWVDSMDTTGQENREPPPSNLGIAAAPANDACVELSATLTFAFQERGKNDTIVVPVCFSFLWYAE